MQESGSDDPDAPQGVRAYIFDMLCELAQLAAENGEDALAISIQRVALQAAGGEPPPVGPRH